MFGVRAALIAMLTCAALALMAVEVQHEFVALKDINTVLGEKLNDGWEVVFSSFVTASPGAQNKDAQMLFIFKKGTV